MNLWLRRIAPLAVLALATTACSSGGSSGDENDLKGKTVNVIGTWGGDEQAAFLKMVETWEKQTGAKVKYTGTRDINTVLTTGVASGVLPDLAGLPGPGQMAEYAKAGKLLPLDDVLDVQTYQRDTAPALVELGKTDGKIHGVFIKAAIKGLIWYNPKAHDYGANPPKTWTDLMSQAKANQGQAKSVWCLGLESGAASGWPATDWIEDLVLRTAGPEVYTKWYEGKVKWSDPAIKKAFQMYVDEVVGNTYGGGKTAVATNFGNAGDPLFANPPGCVFLHQASFITGFSQFKSHTAGTDYNFMPFPDIDPQFTGAVEGAGDLFGMFRDTPAAKSLMKYLVTAEAQDIWVKAGGALSANKNAASYPDDVSKRSAQILADAKTFVFDASDSMPTAMNDAFWKAMVALTNGSKTVDQVLSDLDDAQKDAYTS
ncbi:alpha-glucoside transport system substrate-binding protein [Micromonospora viridifaciens]|uniref:Alpha-glucoside transport system substrate-binding protein n=1 Tax=Micromonospora viridifaciens TaxID=1881 RepID=A0A1C4ZR25_MICVI|nr:extracellular solute-binding protein [Micromonospora viridifaciens]SCF35425.1 alpha-glucoside transport system substrate-binding protein [Micromonospora viridifaciens]